MDTMFLCLCFCTPSESEMAPTGSVGFIWKIQLDTCHFLVLFFEEQSNPHVAGRDNQEVGVDWREEES